MGLAWGFWLALGRIASPAGSIDTRTQAVVFFYHVLHITYCLGKDVRCTSSTVVWQTRQMHSFQGPFSCKEASDIAALAPCLLITCSERLQMIHHPFPDAFPFSAPPIDLQDIQNSRDRQPHLLPMPMNHARPSATDQATGPLCHLMVGPNRKNYHNSETALYPSCGWQSCLACNSVCPGHVCFFGQLR